ncbi:MAG: hypothetical protein AABY22_31565 [Nanoarchaeota archaeon]
MIKHYKCSKCGKVTAAIGNLIPACKCSSSKFPASMDEIIKDKKGYEK